MVNATYSGKIQTKTMKSIIEAADTLNTLNEGTSQSNGNPREETRNATVKLSTSHRPDVTQTDTAPSFPNKLMALMKYADARGNDFSIQWQSNGKAFVIVDPRTFTKDVIPLFFKPTKFTSFTRKLYRWGFRQINRGVGPKDPMIFGNTNFQRDNLDLMMTMKSDSTSKREFKAKQNALHVSFADAKNEEQPFLGNPAISLTSAMLAPTAMHAPRVLCSTMLPVYQMQQDYLYIHPQYLLVNSPVYFMDNGVRYSNPQSNADVVIAAIAALRRSR